MTFHIACRDYRQLLCLARFVSKENVCEVWVKL